VLLELQCLVIPRINQIGAVVLLTLTLAAFGCFSIGSETKVVGIYELNAGKAKITLTVRRDHTFVETITAAGIDNERRSGTWRWTGSLDMESLWIPPAFAPAYILQADARSERGKFKYTQPGHWSLDPEWHFGRVVLPIFPGAGVEFRMVRRG
jgi:hypothetical protein